MHGLLCIENKLGETEKALAQVSRACEVHGIGAAARTTRGEKLFDDQTTSKKPIFFRRQMR